jgi:hypothetical protein
MAETKQTMRSVVEMAIAFCRTREDFVVPVHKTGAEIAAARQRGRVKKLKAKAERLAPAEAAATPEETVGVEAEEQPTEGPAPEATPGEGESA